MSMLSRTAVFFFSFLLRHRRTLRRRRARMIPRGSALAAGLPALIVVALLACLRRSKLLRRFVQAALGNSGGLPFHSFRLSTLCLASQP